MEEVNLHVNNLSPKSPENAGTAQFPDETRSSHETSENQKTMKKSTRRLSLSGKKVATRKGRTYPLRSSFSSSRVLRSKSKPATKSPPPASSSPVKTLKIKHKKRRKTEIEATDEFLRIKKRVRYSLQRISYEQSLIDAYAGEGWRGQSSEKIRPEMELQRAKSEIIRCKLKIRTLFQQLELLISEGKLDETLFDAEGEIGSEDIFCAKCKSMDVSEDNDIILCDGICDRGFHQKCLNPPLSTEDIPPDDEGWLCPACDCKVDCIELINDQLGTNISIGDEWGKVFPEVASLASSNSQYDNLELPSEDSEDHDYNPSDLEAVNPEADEGSKEESSSDESDFSTSSSEGLQTSNHEVHNHKLGLPSDDSEDQDYDPDRPEIDENSPKDLSNSDESDFSSDTDDLDDPGNKISDDNEGSTLTVAKHPRLSQESAMCHLSVGDSELGQESAEPVSGKRLREHLDYKKLYDETYGNQSSDSSDDEEWTARRSGPEKLISDANENDGEGVNKRGGQFVAKISGSKQGKELGRISESMSPVSAEKNSIQKTKTPIKGKTSLKNHLASTKKADSGQSDSNSKWGLHSSHSRFGAAVSQKLQESFRENRYPSREEKEALAMDLGMTLRQVSKWFENTRRNYSVSAGPVSPTKSRACKSSKRLQGRSGI